MLESIASSQVMVSGFRGELLQKLKRSFFVAVSSFVLSASKMLSVKRSKNGHDFLEYICRNSSVESFYNVTDSGFFIAFF